MFWLLLSNPTTAVKETVIRQISNEASSAHPRVIFYLFLAHFDFSICCLDDDFDCRTGFLLLQVTESVSVGKVSQNDMYYFVRCLRAK